MKLPKKLESVFDRARDIYLYRVDPVLEEGLGRLRRMIDETRKPKKTKGDSGSYER